MDLTFFFDEEEFPKLGEVIYTMDTSLGIVEVTLDIFTVGILRMVFNMLSFIFMPTFGD